MKIKIMDLYEKNELRQIRQKSVYHDYQLMCLELMSKNDLQDPKILISLMFKLISTVKNQSELKDRLLAVYDLYLGMERGMRIPA